MLARRYGQSPTVFRDMEPEDLAFVRMCRDAGVQAANDARALNPEAMIFPVMIVGEAT